MLLVLLYNLQCNQTYYGCLCYICYNFVGVHCLYTTYIIHQEHIIQYGKIISQRQYYNQTVTLIEFNDILYENFVLNCTNEQPYFVKCSDKNINLYILLNTRL